ncbi:MAG: hypothetical protein JSW46_03680 [Gemmatimonadota bacterium]|nr:MAG: hypothetical protein JSW46_03680 [Gemmatimonadota bacterium]
MFLSLKSERGGAQTHDLRITSTKLTEDYWGPSDSRLARKRPSNLLRAQREPEALSSACFGELWTTNEDVVFADDDGVVFAPLERAEEVVDVARQSHETERLQAQALLRGQTLYEQLRFGEYLAKRATDPGFAFRDHLREIEGAIEE